MLTSYCEVCGSSRTYLSGKGYDAVTVCIDCNSEVQTPTHKETN